MATSGADPRSDHRRFGALALLVTALAHAPALAGGLIDADRLLLVHHPDIRSFAGLGNLLSAGEPLVRASGLIARNHAPLGVISTWLGWQWFRASPIMQHAVGLAAALATAAALFALLSPRRTLAMIAVLALVLHPSAADLTAPLLGRDALLATWIALYAARRAQHARATAAIAWSAGASLAAGLCAPGFGLLGLIAALMIADQGTRRRAVAASSAAALAALALLRGDLAHVSVLDAIGPGAGAAFIAWIPSPTPFVIATVSDAATAGLVPAMILAALAFLGASRLSEERDAALLRAGGGAMIAALLASAIACRDGTITGVAAFTVQLGVVLALAGLWDTFASRLRPWMLALFAIPLAVTAVRARAWADEDRTLAAIVARDADDPEALLARARLAVRRGNLDEALPFAMRHADAAPDSHRGDGCIAAAAIARGDEAAAIALLQRWAARFDEKRALRAAVLELAIAQPDPRFAEAFRRATGFKMPTRRPGEQW